MPNEQDEPDVRADRFVGKIEAWQLSQCLGCVHWEGDRTCAAFDDMKVPLEILANEFDHREPHPQDNGTQYEPKDDDTEHPMDHMRTSRPG